ncbi:MAG TPA: hypothetical protein VGF86_03465 [Candidatus Tumulicola sp.]
MPDRREISAAAIVAGALAFVILDVLAFYVALYRPWLDPFSTTGAFESAIARLSELRSDPRSDVLVLGDSRIYSGLDPRIASAASGGRLRFLDGSVPGTTPRCWFFYARVVDPKTDRFRAIVIPVDTYRDDDSAIGSRDGDRRAMDLHYIALRARPSDIPKLASSFGDWRARLNVGTDLILRGPELRDDVQAFAADPAARFRAIERAAAADAYDPLAAHPRIGSLSGLHGDFATERMTFPRGIAQSERGEIRAEVLQVARPSPDYAQYRRRWLGPIVDRYLAAGVPVIFVRLPTRPAHRSAGDGASGSLLEFARAGARLIAQSPYLALERPELFADHDHLNEPGSRAFSMQLGRDVARALDEPSSASLPPNPGKREPPSPRAPGNAAPETGHPFSIGVPLPFQSYEFWIFFTLTMLLFRATAGRLRWALLLAARAGLIYSARVASSVSP